MCDRKIFLTAFWWVFEQNVAKLMNVAVFKSCCNGNLGFYNVFAVWYEDRRLENLVNFGLGLVWVVVWGRLSEWCSSGEKKNCGKKKTQEIGNGGVFVVWRKNFSCP